MPSRCSSLLIIALLLKNGLGGFVLAAEDPADLEFFERNVRPLLVEHCYECHSGEERGGGLLVDSRQGLLTGGDSGPAIVPGDPSKSLLMEAVGYQNLDLQMPPTNRLSDQQIGHLQHWIQVGAPDPRTANSTSLSKGPVGMSVEAGRQFWSMRPVANPVVPPVQDTSWIQNPIDAFILARLEQAGLRPAPPADRRSLLRRVTFDLTGLPPTQVEIDAFLSDESPDAYRNLVERLLESPAYGERWGRHWLDVARYSDSNGLDENLAFGNAWRYRDYVVDAFNRDMPFDRFVTEQLAGDLVPWADQQSRTATGFLALGAKVLAEPDKEKLVMDTIDEQLDTLGKAFMGMTLGCVRCHDHKFDPLKQTDYYALAAIFKSTKTFADTNTGAIKHWYEHSLDADESLLESLKSIDAKIAAAKRAASGLKSAQIASMRDQARDRAAKYLVACTKFGPDLPLYQIEAIAEQFDLHPRILHHCRRHLEFNRDDSVFGPWHELAIRGGSTAVEEYYRDLFNETNAALAAARKKNPKASRLNDPRLEAARAALYDLSGFLAVPDKPEFAFDRATLAEYNRLMDEARVLESNAPDAPSVMGVGEQTTLESLPIHIRGSHLNLGDPVSREFPEVMRTSTVETIFPSHQSGRLELARWLASTAHPLTARVYVNRVWGWHFQRGIVASTENFGALGDRPSHPELLDWLARSLMKSGWSTKQLHRWILLSNTYRMSATHPSIEQVKEFDPENRLLARSPIRRLEAESIRDSLLSIAGQLQRTIGGKTIPLRNRQFVFNHTSVDHTKYDSLRRSIYLPIIRNNLYSFFAQFDYPDPTMPTGRRSSTVVAPQALLMMNNEMVMDAADAWAQQLIENDDDDRNRIVAAYSQAFCRRPSAAETERATRFLDQMASQQSHRTSWAMLCQSLFASNEFIYLR